MNKMRRLLIFLLGLLCACSARTDVYDTLDDATSANVFAKGWLPSGVLPASTAAIRVTTLVDVASGDGEFEYSCTEHAGLVKVLEQYDSRTSKIAEHREQIQQLIGDGYEPLVHSQGKTQWIFLCKARSDVCACRFFVWQPDH